jgi:hypothetical protein
MALLVDARRRTLADVLGFGIVVALLLALTALAAGGSHRAIGRWLHERASRRVVGGLVLVGILATVGGILIYRATRDEHESCLVLRTATYADGDLVAVAVPQDSAVCPEQPLTHRE